MPTASDDVEIKLEFSIEALKEILAMNDGDQITTLTTEQEIVGVTRKGDIFLFEFSQNVEIEFDMNDYAPDNDWRD